LILILVAGCNGSSGPLASAELYHPDSGALVTGGVNPTGVLSSAEVYAPLLPGTAGSWLGTGSLLAGRSSTTPVLLTSGPMPVPC
jgi:hypothetical protein